MTLCSSLWRYICRKSEDYFDNSGIHGLRYISDSKRHITERLFWAGTCLLAIFGTYRLFQASWYNFQNNAVTFVVETSYLEWNTTFPAVSVCENDSPDKIFDSGKTIFGKDRNMNMDFYLRDIVYFDGTCYSCKTHCGTTMNCTEDLKYLLDQVRSPCDKFMSNCMWNGKPFDCCSQFLPLETETGPCFTLNSIHTTPMGEPKLTLISNRATGPGELVFHVYESAKLFIHSPDDVPYVNHPQEEKALLNWGTVFIMSFQINEIYNDPLLNDVSVEQRNCRFPNENILDIYNFYSYSACVVDCRAKAQIEFCNCTHHFMPKMKGIETCNTKGLACLTAYSETLRALKTKDNDAKKGLVCDCMSSCDEPEYTVLQSKSTPNEDYRTERFGSKVSVVLDELPSHRFMRNVVRTRLDLVVSMGGTAGLFLGASLLSVAEVFVFLLLRSPSTQKEELPMNNTDMNVAVIETKNYNNINALITPYKNEYNTQAHKTSKKVYPILPYLK